MARSFLRQFFLSLRQWWSDNSPQKSLHEKRSSRISQLLSKFWEFLRESLPDRRRQRYGDMEFDWDHRVDTTSGTTQWRERLLGAFHSPYQPTEPTLFRKMLSAVTVEFDGYTFIDIGSGKGRALLMASHYPFKQIIGVELIEELHRVAQRNIREYTDPAQQCRKIQSVRANAVDFEFPAEPTLLYLFNPLPETALTALFANLQSSIARNPRKIWVVYHNPLFMHLLDRLSEFQKMGGTQQYAIYCNRDVPDDRVPHRS